MQLVIRGSNLPGAAFEGHERIGVGLQVGDDVVDVVPGDAWGARWATDIEVVDGDVRGPAVHGRRGERFVYLAWGDVAGGDFEMFRRAKLMLSGVDPALLAEAVRPGHALDARVQLTDSRGGPVAARLHPPAIRWGVEPSPRLRSAVRAVLLDPADRILLVRFDFHDRIVWAAPGGGIEDGEAEEVAIRRELDEEVGLTSFELGPCVWTREHVFPFVSGLWDGQRERFYLVRCAAFEPRPRFTAEELAAEGMTGMRWWTPAELRASDAVFAPRRLSVLLDELLAGRLPASPIDAGI